MVKGEGEEVGEEEGEEEEGEEGTGAGRGSENSAATESPNADEDQSTLMTRECRPW